MDVLTIRSTRCYHCKVLKFSLLHKKMKPTKKSCNTTRKNSFLIILYIHTIIDRIDKSGGESHY